MADIIIRRCTVAELEAVPNAAQFVAEYASEGGLPELGKASPQVGTYRLLEESGALHPIGAFDGDRLLGFIIPIVVVLPHYGVLAATVESFFVLKSERKDGVGMKLLEAAENLALDMGAKALLLSAPAAGALARVMAHTPRYRHSNDVFVTALT